MSSTCSDWYDANARQYCAETAGANVSDAQRRFARLIPRGGRILDIGCGSGRDAAYFSMLGFAVDARDASAAMATEARKMTGVHVKVESVLELCEVSRFDGVWASALLVHFADPEFGEAVVRMTQALTPGGVLYLSVKQGTGEAWVGGRWFRYWTPTALTDRLRQERALHVREMWSATDSTRAGTEWINVLATRVGAQ